MRTTVDLPDRLFRRAKAEAALRGVRLKRLFLEALESHLAQSAKRRRKKRIVLPLIKSDRPGSLKLTGDDLARYLEEEDLSAPTRH